MVGRIFKLAGVSLGLILLAASLPIYAQNSTENEVIAQTNNREASIVCKRAQTKLSDYLENIEEIKTEQLSSNRSVLAFVNNIALRLEHNEQAEDTDLSDNVTNLNDLITDQDVAYVQLESNLRVAISSSCTSDSDVDDLRDKMSDIRDEVASINQLQLDFEDYVSTTVVDNLEDIQGQLDETSESAEANS